MFLRSLAQASVRLAEHRKKMDGTTNATGNRRRGSNHADLFPLASDIDLSRPQKLLKSVLHCWRVVHFVITVLLNCVSALRQISLVVKSAHAPAISFHAPH